MIFKRNKGVTLIALVLTIVLTIILAGITINSLSGNDNIVNGSKKISNENMGLVINSEQQINALYDELNPPNP